MTLSVAFENSRGWSWKATGRHRQRGSNDESNFNLRSKLVTNYSLSTVSSIGALDLTRPG